MNILIVDDNNEALKELQQTLSEMTDAVIRCCASEKAVLDMIADDSFIPDIVFMDIVLQDLGGIGLAKQILAVHPHAQIIFISGYDDYYLDVYDVEHIYFIRKPVDSELLKKAFSLATKKAKKIEKEVFTFNIGHQKMLLPYHDILYFEKLKRKVVVYTRVQTAPFSYYATMSSLLEQLPETFIRCHNSFIINLDAVTSYRRDNVQIGNAIIPVSRKYKDSVSQAFYHNLEAHF